MSEAKHTPGPWEYSPDLGGHHGCCLIHAADGYLVADAGRISRRTIAEMNANASLIAAAPDLLRELVTFHDYAIQLGIHHCGQDGQPCPVQAAINKATGGTS